jgi:hypothetical protein
MAAFSSLPEADLRDAAKYFGKSEVSQADNSVNQKKKFPAW